MNRPLLSLLVLRKLGFHGSRAAKKRILFNVLLITLVVAALEFAQIFVVSMSKGIADKYALLGNGHLQVHQTDSFQPTDSSLLLDVQKVAQSHALVYSAEANKMVRIKGVGSNYFNQYRLKELKLFEAKDLEATTLPKVLVSTTLADQLGVGAGDRIAVMLVNQRTIRPQLVVIRALYDSGYKELDENLIFCNFDLMHRLFEGKEETYHELLVDSDNIERLKQQYRQQGYRVTSWDEENYGISTNLATSRQAVLAVMVAVAMLCGYFISELARELVEDDKHRIAMLTLLGARKQFIRAVYFTTVFSVTVISIVCGTLLGIVMATNLSPVLAFIAEKSLPSLSYYLLEFTIFLPIADLALIIAVLVAVSMISVLWSLRRVKVIEPLSCTHFD